MKVSDRILIGFVALAVAGAVALVVGLRVAAGTPGNHAVRTAGFSVDSISYRGESFRWVAVSGNWKVVLRHGDTPSVVIDRPDSVFAHVKVYVGEDTLFLVSSSMALSQDGVTARITTPRCNGFSGKGALEGRVTGFTEETLTVVTAGGSEVAIRECTLGLLRLNLSGFSDIQAEESVAGALEVHTGGAFGIKVRLDGGPVWGTAGGMGGIELYGKKGENTLETSGMVDVSYHE